MTWTGPARPPAAHSLRSGCPHSSALGTSQLTILTFGRLHHSNLLALGKHRPWPMAPSVPHPMPSASRTISKAENGRAKARTGVDSTVEHIPSQLVPKGLECLGDVDPALRPATQDARPSRPGTRAKTSLA